MTQTPWAARVEVAHADFRAKRVPLMDHMGNQLNACLEDGVHLRYRVQAEDVAAYLLRLSGLLDEMAADGLPMPPELKADCAVLVVNEPLILPSPIALPALDFRGTRFLSDVTLSDAVFHGHANFHRADFLGEADFTNANFHQGADYRRTVFCKGTGFFCAMGNRIIDFSGATFIGHADFEGHISSDFNFDDVKFLGGTDFS